MMLNEQRRSSSNKSIMIHKKLMRSERKQKYPEAVKHYTKALRRNLKDPKLMMKDAAERYLS